MELRHLRYFTAVAAYGSFNRAAQVLHVTQPALSRQLKDLEDELGVALFARSKNAVTLTAAGQTFFEQAREVLAMSDKALSIARGEGGMDVLHVGYIPATVYDIVTRAFANYHHSRPNVKVELLEMLPKEMKQRASEGSVDVIIVPEAGYLMIPGYRWSNLFRVESRLVMPQDHALASLRTIPPARLRDLPLIGLGKVNFPGYAPLIRDRFQRFGVSPRFVALIEGGVGPLLGAVLAHRAAAVLGDTIESMLPPGLVARPFTPKLPAARVMAGIPEVNANQYAEEFVAILAQEAKGRTRGSDS